MSFGKQVHQSKLNRLSIQIGNAGGAGFILKDQFSKTLIL